MKYADTMDAVSAAQNMASSAAHLLLGQLMECRHRNNVNQLLLDDVRQLLQRALERVDQLRAG